MKRASQVQCLWTDCIPRMHFDKCDCLYSKRCRLNVYDLDCIVTYFSLRSISIIEISIVFVFVVVSYPSTCRTAFTHENPEM